jgi:hypothetical protein
MAKRYSVFLPPGLHNVSKEKLKIRELLKHRILKNADIKVISLNISERRAALRK